MGEEYRGPVCRSVGPVEEVSPACSSVTRRDRSDSLRPVGERKRSVRVDPAGLTQLSEGGLREIGGDGLLLQDDHIRSDELKWAMTRVNLESSCDGDLSVYEDGAPAWKGHRWRASDR